MDFYRKVTCIVALLTTINVSCASLSFSSKDVLVERSASEKPVWLNDPASLENPVEFYAAYHKPKVFLLELGMKQAQANAISNSKALFFSTLRKKMENLLNEPSVKEKKIENAKVALDEAIAQVEKSYSPTDGTQKGVYWENWRRETPEGTRNEYEVWIQLRFRKGEYNDAVAQIIDRLKNSQNQQAKVLGNALFQSLDGGVSEEEG
jgi:hypothetical protein